ncbi:MAG: hypothetical protein QOD74_423 [Variibacter sp.]|nr:hypothetical protein [Variibacter sp.]
MHQNTPSSQAKIPFIDLQAQRRRLGSSIDEAISRVLSHGQYILGPEVQLLENDLAHFCGARHAITCANGTDALLLVLMARGVGPGAAVFCPSFTFAATAEVIALAGATPVFVDVLADTFNMDPKSLEAAIVTARRDELSPTAVIAVDLFGQPADYDAILQICEAEGLWLLDDAAQSFGATYRDRKIGTIGAATATSFFPAKPLGCYGDGGAIFTDDDELAATLRSLRMHGEGVDKYDNVRVGLNSRLDTLQAAILIEKLKVFADEIAAREEIAARYSEQLGDIVDVPVLATGNTSVWAQYTIKMSESEREAAMDALASEGIPSVIYYRKPLHRQPAYAHYPAAGNGLPVSDQLARQVLSLPMHSDLRPEVQDRIVDVLRRTLRTEPVSRVGRS